MVNDSRLSFDGEVAKSWMLLEILKHNKTSFGPKMLDVHQQPHRRHHETSREALTTARLRLKIRVWHEHWFCFRRTVELSADVVRRGFSSLIINGSVVFSLRLVWIMRSVLMKRWQTDANEIIHTFPCTYIPQISSLFCVSTISLQRIVFFTSPSSWERQKMAACSCHLCANRESL